MTNYLVNDVFDRDLVGLRISNTENVQEKLVRISFRRLDLLKPFVVWVVLGKVVQSNAMFGLSNRFEVCLDHVRMLAGNGREKTKGRSLELLSAIKKFIVKVKAEFLCLAHALITDMAKVNGDPKHKYRDGYGLKQPIQDLLIFSGIKLTNGGGLKELEQFQNHLSDYEIFCMMA